jgi:hypothetical protein
MFGMLDSGGRWCTSGNEWLSFFRTVVEKTEQTYAENRCSAFCIMFESERKMALAEEVCVVNVEDD